MLYRATFPLASGETAAVSFDYDEPGRGHRLDPDSYVPSQYWLRSMAVDGVEIGRESREWPVVALEILLFHKPDLFAAVREAHAAEWQSYFA